MKHLLLILIILLVSPIETSLRSGDNININQPIPDDLYVAGGTVTVNAPIHGDLIVAGGTVTINDTVHHDLIASGGTVVINGYVGDDIRCAGGTVELSRNVRDDVVLAGGDFTMNEDAVVGGNFIAVGGRLMINGKVNGELMVRGGDIEFNGSVENDADIRGGEIDFNGVIMGNAVIAAQEIDVGSDASFLQELRYWNDDGELDVGSSMARGDVVFDDSLEMESDRWELLGFSSILLLLWYLGTALLMIFIIQYLFGPSFRKAADTALKESVKSVGYGVLFCLGLPIAIVVAFFSVVGIPIAFILLFIMITLFFFATSITSLVAAHWIHTVYYGSAWTTAKIVFVAFAIFIVLKLFTFTPFIGPLIMLLLALLAFGSLLLNVQWKRKQTAG